MKYDSLDYKVETSEVGVYECEVHLKFRLIEEKGVLNMDREQLLDLLLEAISYGSDEHLEFVQTKANAQEISEFMASPQMRRQLMRLRNAKD